MLRLLLETFLQNITNRSRFAAPVSSGIQKGNLLDEGSDVAATVFSDVGVYLAYSLLYYYDFYKFQNVLLMGRVMSGLGGEIIMNKANEVLKNHGADKKFRILLPDENFRRLGQSVAASYLG